MPRRAVSIIILYTATRASLMNVTITSICVGTCGFSRSADILLLQDKAYTYGSAAPNFFINCDRSSPVLPDCSLTLKTLS